MLRSSSFFAAMNSSNCAGVRVSASLLALGLMAFKSKEAAILDLDEHTEYKPMLQLGGFSLPGFSAGHYLLRNRNRAFCLLTARRNVLLLPQRDGKLILVSPEKPQALLDALRAA